MLNSRVLFFETHFSFAVLFQFRLCYDTIQYIYVRSKADDMASLI